MNFIQNSGDILNIVIAASIAIFVFFVCWGLFYIITIFRNVSKITKDARKGFSKASEIMDRIKEQVENGTFYFSLVSEGLKRGVDFLKKKTEGSGRSKKNNNKSTAKNNNNSSASRNKSTAKRKKD